MHSVLPPKFYHAATKLYCQFDDNSVEEGSGFILRHGEKRFVLSARHVFDPSYRPADLRSDKRLKSLRVLFKYGIKSDSGDGFRIPNFHFQDKVIENPTLICSPDDCDLSAITFESQYYPISIPEDGLASDEDIGNSFPGEPVCFVGFPTGSPIQNFDHVAVGATPILRSGTLAAFPIADCEIRDAIGNYYGVIDGFAKRGFSGSPLFLLPRRSESFGQKKGGVSARRGCLLGLIAGHLRSKEDRADGIHSGLAYFTKVTSIRKMLGI